MPGIVQLVSCERPAWVALCGAGLHVQLYPQYFKMGFGDLLISSNIHTSPAYINKLEQP